jgi:hypothetical protein
VEHHCPVCGYNELQHAPELFTICPCCGTEFGNSDFGVSHEELRACWLARGAPWFDAGTPRPPAWSADKQLAKAGFRQHVTVN